MRSSILTKVLDKLLYLSDVQLHAFLASKFSTRLWHLRHYESHVIVQESSENFCTWLQMVVWLCRWGTVPREAPGFIMTISGASQSGTPSSRRMSTCISMSLSFSQSGSWQSAVVKMWRDAWGTKTFLKKCFQQHSSNFSTTDLRAAFKSSHMAVISWSCCSDACSVGKRSALQNIGRAEPNGEHES